jgi:hypothetical protein
MPTVTSKNLEEFQLREMARRAGQKYEAPNPYAGKTKDELKVERAHIKSAMKSIKNAEKAGKNSQ